MPDPRVFKVPPERLTPGRLIKAFREDAGLSQRQLALQLGVSQPTLHRFERDRLDGKTSGHHRVSPPWVAMALFGLAAANGYKLRTSTSAQLLTLCREQLELLDRVA